MGKKLKICFMGGKYAGIVGALAVLSKGHNIISAVSYSDDLTDILHRYQIPVYASIQDKDFIEQLEQADLLLSIHGKEIVPVRLLHLPVYGAVNVHPYLYAYKGADSVGRALRDGNFRASVGAHIMDKNVDGGEVLVEEFVDVSGSTSTEEVYNKLYPAYCKVTLKILEKIKDGFKKTEFCNKEE